MVMNNRLDEDSVVENISWSEQLIETLEETTKVSENIVQQAKAFHETQRMLENSRFISVLSRDQIRRSRRAP